MEGALATSVNLPWGFVFATGLECSYPTIRTPEGKTKRMDELEKTFHYQRWREDLHLVRDLGLRYLRYGPPYYRMHLGPKSYDFEFNDLVFAEMQRLGIVPIVDLCHFGVPDWVGDFQNPEWPEWFAQYARDFAARYPWVQFYTPINEIYVCAKFSTLFGLWNERRKNDHRAFVTAIKQMCRANLLAVREILRVRSDAIFVQSESAEHYHRGGYDPVTDDRVNFENQLRFISLDLVYSVRPCADVCLYLLDNGMTRDEFHWFMNHGLGDRIIMGNDFYVHNESIVLPGGDTQPIGEVFGWAIITNQYFERYRRPVMHTETNYPDEKQAPHWLWKQFFNVRYLRRAGVPVLGFTWYCLVDQVDWNSALSQDNGTVNPVGLYDLNRKIRPVGLAYRDLVQNFQTEPLLPRSSVLGFFEGATPHEIEQRRAA
jgi:beta-glucosidase/6-phospho-beta-glucosidase/beta-galactosidase